MAMGEIWVSSPGVMRDYWREPTPVGEPLRDGWLKTGDLGFMRDGELFVGGRLKDVIFHGGANLFAEDYEAVAESVPGVRKGNAIAFAITDLERMVAIVESAADRDSLPGLATSVFAALADRLPRAPDEVAVWRPGRCRRLRRASARGAFAAICTFRRPCETRFRFGLADPRSSTEGSCRPASPRQRPRSHRLESSA